MLKPELGVLPPRIAKLPLDERGYPVPWFVGWIDGKPEFRAMDARKLRIAIEDRLCWVCGERLGRWLAFPIGPMCAITRTTAEPPSHVDCAEWSIKHCPFLSNPDMVRRHDDMPAGVAPPAGFGIMRNPGVLCLWITRGYEVFNDGRGKPLITVGTPERVTWWREGREASRAEILASIDTGLPILLNAARADGRFAVEELERQTDRVRALLPAESSHAV